MFNTLFVAFFVVEFCIVGGGLAISKITNSESKPNSLATMELSADENRREYKIIASSKTTTRNNSVRSVGITGDYNTDNRLASIGVRDTEDLKTISYNDYSKLSDYDRLYVDSARNKIKY